MAWGNTGPYNDTSNFVSCKCQHHSLCYADGRTTTAELAPALSFVHVDLSSDWNLTAPDKATEWTFKGIVTPVKDPYCPPHSKLVQRYTINNGSHMGRRNNGRMSSGNTPAIRTLNVHNMYFINTGGNPVFIE